MKKTVLAALMLFILMNSIAFAQTPLKVRVLTNEDFQEPRIEVFGPDPKLQHFFDVTPGDPVYIEDGNILEMPSDYIISQTTKSGRTKLGVITPATDPNAHVYERTRINTVSRGCHVPFGIFGTELDPHHPVFAGNRRTHYNLFGIATDNIFSTFVAGQIALVQPSAWIINFATANQQSGINFTAATHYANNQVREIARSSGGMVVLVPWTKSQSPGFFLDAVNAAAVDKVIFVFSAGNDGSRHDFDSIANTVIVGGSDSNDFPLPQSGFGSAVRFATASDVCSAYPGGTYATGSGSSFALPWVGIALSCKLASGSSITEAINCLDQSLDPINGSRTGKGRLNAQRMFTDCGRRPQTQPPVVTINVITRCKVGDNVAVVVSAHDPDGGNIVRYHITFNGKVFTSPNFSEQLATAGTFDLIARVWDDENEEGVASIKVICEDGPPPPPTGTHPILISDRNGGVILAKQGISENLGEGILTNDSHGHQLFYRWQTQNVISNELATPDFSTVYTAGKWNAKLTVRCSAGSTAEANYQVIVADILIARAFVNSKGLVVVTGETSMQGDLPDDYTITVGNVGSQQITLRPKFSVSKGRWIFKVKITVAPSATHVDVVSSLGGKAQPLIEGLRTDAQINFELKQFDLGDQSLEDARGEIYEKIISCVGHKKCRHTAR